MNIAQRLLLLFLLVTSAASQPDSSRAIQIINDSGRSLKLYWIDPEQSGEGRLHLIDETSLAEPGSQLGLSSFVGHVFEAHENPDPSTGICTTDSGDQLCRVASFNVQDDVLEEQSTWEHEILLVEFPSAVFSFVFTVWAPPELHSQLILLFYFLSRILHSA
jgi:hypothetical protein